MIILFFSPTDCFCQFSLELPRTGTLYDGIRKPALTLRVEVLRAVRPGYGLTKY